MDSKAEKKDWFLLSVALIILMVAIVKYCLATVKDASDALSGPVVSLIFGFAIIGCYRKQIGELIGRVKSLGSTGIYFESEIAGKVKVVEPQKESAPVKSEVSKEQIALRTVELKEVTDLQIKYDPLEETTWNAIYKKNRDIFLVHEIAPSKSKALWYDIFIYLVNDPTQPNFLDTIEKAEFYLGPDWGKEPFVVIPKKDERIGIQTQAWGEILCTCRITFRDEKPDRPKIVFMERWIDFRMKGVFNLK